MKKEEFQQEIPHLLNFLKQYGLALTHNKHDTDDLVQETLVRAFSNLHRFDKKNGCLRAWLRVIMRNIFFNLYRRNIARKKIYKNKIEQNIEQQFDHLVIKQSENIDDSIKRSIEGLSRESREIFLLLTIGESKYKTISEITGIPIGTVMSKIFHTRKQLKERLQLAGYE